MDIDCAAWLTPLLQIIEPPLHMEPGSKQARMGVRVWVDAKGVAANLPNLMERPHGPVQRNKGVAPEDQRAHSAALAELHKTQREAKAAQVRAARSERYLTKFPPDPVSVTVDGGEPQRFVRPEVAMIELGVTLEFWRLCVWELDRADGASFRYRDKAYVVVRCE